MVWTVLAHLGFLLSSGFSLFFSMTHSLLADDGIVGKSLPAFVTPLIAWLVTSMKSDLSSFRGCLWCRGRTCSDVASDGDNRNEVCLPFLSSFGWLEKLVCYRGGCCRMQYIALSACEPLLVVLPHFPYDCLCLEATIFPLQI